MSYRRSQLEGYGRYAQGLVGPKKDHLQFCSATGQLLVGVYLKNTRYEPEKEMFAEAVSCLRSPSFEPTNGFWDSLMTEYYALPKVRVS